MEHIYAQIFGCTFLIVKPEYHLFHATFRPASDDEVDDEPLAQQPDSPDASPKKTSSTTANAKSQPAAKKPIKIDKEKLLRLLNDDDDDVSDLSSDSDQEAGVVNAASSDEGINFGECGLLLRKFRICF